MVKVVVKKTKEFEAIDLRLKELGKFDTVVGWNESAKYEDGTSVAYVAAIQEFGTKGIPPRPFMRPAIDKHESEWMDVAKMGAKEILNGTKTGKEAMDLVGLKSKGDVYESIVDVNEPPLSMITLVARLWRKQGKTITGGTIGEIAARLHAGEKFDVSGISTKPLNDTGHMLSTLTTETVAR